MKRVLVLNHFAVPRGEAGGTRHEELFSRLDGWSYLLVTASTHPMAGGQARVSSKGMLAVPTTPYSRNGVTRMVNWTSYATSVTLRGMTGLKADLVYASSPHLLAGLAGWAIAKRRRVPFVLEVRDLWPKVLVDMKMTKETSQMYRQLTRLEEFLYSEADAIIVFAEGVRNHLVARGVSGDLITLIPNAADPEDFLVSDSREALRHRFGFDRTTFVYAGAHGPANGLDLVLDAAAEIADLEVEFVLVGDGVEKQRLVAEANRRGLRNVRFLDPVPKVDIPPLLAAADVGLHVLADVPLFRYGVSPNKVFDYLAAGLPVLTNTPGEVTELLERSVGGIGVGPAELAEGIERMLALGSSSRLAMGRAGQEYMAEHQSRTAMAGRLQTLLDSLA